MTTRKKIIAAFVLCSVLFTGCGMSDNAADMASEISVPTLNTAKEIDAALAQMSDTVEENWVINKENQQQFKDLYNLLKAEEKKGTLRLDMEDKYVLELMEADNPDDKAFQDTESALELEIDNESNLKSLFQELDKAGYTGAYDMVCNAIEKNKSENEDDTWWGEIRFTLKNVTFCTSFFDTPYAMVWVSMNENSIRYPESMKDLLENKLQNGFSINGISTGGYLQAISFYTEMCWGGSPFNKSAVLYLKDGKAVQMDMYIQLAHDVIELEQKDKFKGSSDVFFTEQEAETFAGLMELFGANSSDALEFAKKVGEKSESRGLVNDVSWQLKENAMPRFGSERNWLLRIQ